MIEALRKIYDERDTPENNKMLDEYFISLGFTNLVTGKPWKRGDTKAQWSAYRENTTAHKKDMPDMGMMSQELNTEFLKKTYWFIREFPTAEYTENMAKLLVDKLCRVSIPIAPPEEIVKVPLEIMYPPVDAFGNLHTPYKDWMNQEVKDFMEKYPNNKAVIRLKTLIKNADKLERTLGRTRI